MCLCDCVCVCVCVVFVCVRVGGWVSVGVRTCVCVCVVYVCVCARASARVAKHACLRFWVCMRACMRFTAALLYHVDSSMGVYAKLMRWCVCEKPCVWVGVSAREHAPHGRIRVRTCQRVWAWACECTAQV